MTENNEPTTAMQVDAYHAAMRIANVDVLGGIMPRLRRNPEKCKATPKPLTAKTKARQVRDICTVYFLLTGRKATENRDHFHDGGEYKWAQDVPFILMASGRAIRTGKDNLSEDSALKRIEAIAQLCDMVHSESALKAAEDYRRVVRHGKERAQTREKAPRWTRSTATDELTRIRSVLASEWDRVLTLTGDDRIAALLQWIRVCVLFGADHDGQESTLQPLRGGCWPQVTFGALDSVHPKLESTALGCIVEDEHGDTHLKMPECTKTYMDVSVNLSNVCPALVAALDLLRPIAFAAHGGWVMPTNDALDGTRTNRYKTATKGLLGTAYTPTNARHLVYTAGHGNTIERAEEARQRGATAQATAQSYGDN